MKNIIKKTAIYIFILMQISEISIAEGINEKINKYVDHIYPNSKIPGMSIVTINGGQTIIKNYGYADKENAIKVKSSTKFEIGSCSKSFTALAILKLVKQNKIEINQPVEKYLPWFHVKYKGKKEKLLIKHLLFHTSGIPWKTISDIPESNNKKSIENTVKNLIGYKLISKPGDKYSYATINYDVLGLIIEKVTGQTYHDYMNSEIFQPLGLKDTSIGGGNDDPDKSKGYKISFFKPILYDAPIFKGNDPAGYVVTNALNMAHWMKLQMGMIPADRPGFTGLFQQSHTPDRSVSPDKFTLTNYAYGWFVSQERGGRLFHGGSNPNFTTFVGFNVQKKAGVAILSNSNSSFTPHIAKNILNLLDGRQIDEKEPGLGVDKGLSIFAIIIVLFIAGLITYFISILFGIIRKKRQFNQINIKVICKIALFLLLSFPLAYGLYIFPAAIFKVNWNTAIVWAPLSFITSIYLIMIAWALCFVVYVSLLVFNKEENNKQKIPMFVLLGVASGFSNTIIIYLVTVSVLSNVKLIYLLYYYLLAFAVYILGTKIVRTKLIQMSNIIIYNMRIRLFEKIFELKYQHFEKFDSGRIYATLNNDTETIGDSANIIVSFFTSIVTIICAFTIMLVISFKITALILLIISTIAVLYYLVTQKSMVYLELARDSQSEFMTITDGIVKGFKELSLHSRKRIEYKSDVTYISENYRDRVITARTKFLNAFLVGESLLLLIIGFITFAIPEIFKTFNTSKLSTFIMILLYLIGPINAILSSIPNISKIYVSWKRVKAMTDEISDKLEKTTQEIIKGANVKIIQSIRIENICYSYENEPEISQFSVGPINLEVKKGEVLFIIGGNGSGKTTLAKLICGLYNARQGALIVNEFEVTNSNIGEVMSVVFSDFHLFDKLYEIDFKSKKAEIDNYLKLLELNNKVSIVNGKFSTTNLSGGQKKRLALLKCFLEDRPVYLFDEWAADQDPEYKKFFYHNLLPQMKKNGKIVIAITHDDNYFTVADKIIKMDMGEIKYIKGFSESALN